MRETVTGYHFDMLNNPTSLRVLDPGIRSLFTLESRWQAWLDVEVALARAESELGVIPHDAATEIAAKAQLDLLDRARIDEGLRRTAHPLVPLVWELSRICTGDAGRYVHWGATTQNIVQTGDLLILRRAHAIFLRQIAAILRDMADLAERSRDMALPGRTHGQHAVPATFGFKVGVWIDEYCRHCERLRGVESRIFRAMLGGAAGTFASFDAKGPAIQARMAAHLNMAPMAVPARTIADHQAEYVTILGLLAATGGKIGREIYTLMKQEFGEAEEPVPPGTVGSSTMPQKRNPKLSQDIIAMSAELRALVPLALEAMLTEHEADRTTSLMMQHAMEQSCGLTGDILARLQVMIAGLKINPGRMRRNLDLSGGLIMAEALMLSLGAHIGRQEAHDAIYDAAQEAATGDQSFAALLAQNRTVTAHLGAEDIARLLDPTAYLGECAQIASDQAARARIIAAEISEISDA
jgi:adenylosuccinate lyase